jgi:hypothetical protein
MSLEGEQPVDLRQQRVGIPLIVLMKIDEVLLQELKLVLRDSLQYILIIVGEKEELPAPPPLPLHEVEHLPRVVVQLEGLEDILQVIVGQHHLEYLRRVYRHLALQDPQARQEGEIDEVVFYYLRVDRYRHLFVVVDLPHRAGDLHLVVGGRFGLGVVAEEVPAVGLVDVVVLLVGDVDARDDGDDLGDLEDVQLAVLLFYVQEQLLVVGGGLRGAKE